MTKTYYQNLWDKIRKQMITYMEGMRHSLSNPAVSATFVFSPVMEETNCEEFFVCLVMADLRNGVEHPTFALTFTLHESKDGANVSLTLEDVGKLETLWAYRPDNYSQRVWSNSVTDLCQRVSDAPYEDALTAATLAMNRASQVPRV